MERQVKPVVGGHGSTHKAGKTQKHRAALHGEVTLFFQTPCSLDFNADGRVWKRVKQRIARPAIGAHTGNLVALSAFRSLQQRPEKNRGFHGNPPVVPQRYKFRSRDHMPT